MQRIEQPSLCARVSRDAPSRTNLPPWGSERALHTQARTHRGRGRSSGSRWVPATPGTALIVATGQQRPRYTGMLRRLTSSLRLRAGCASLDLGMARGDPYAPRTQGCAGPPGRVGDAQVTRPAYAGMGPSQVATTKSSARAPRVCRDGPRCRVIRLRPSGGGQAYAGTCPPAALQLALPAAPAYEGMGRPRTWGLTSHPVRPAYAGMSRTRRTAQARSARAPRVRRDGPHKRRARVLNSRCAPHRQGYAVRRIPLSRNHVCPEYAGMHPNGTRASATLPSAPCIRGDVPTSGKLLPVTAMCARVRGDVPVSKIKTGITRPCAPRTRGCTRERLAQLIALRVPRVCRDEPVCLMVLMSAPPCALRMQGCSGPARPGSDRRRVRPRGIEGCAILDGRPAGRGRVRPVYRRDQTDLL